MKPNLRSRPGKLLGMLHAVLGLGLVAFPAQADVWTFETPSENIQCTVGQEAGIQSDASAASLTAKSSQK